MLLRTAADIAYGLRCRCCQSAKQGVWNAQGRPLQISECFVVNAFSFAYVIQDRGDVLVKA